MIQRLRRSLSYANVTATLALLLSLGGGAYAAVTLPAHSVGAEQLRRGAVTRNALGFDLGGRALALNQPRAFALDSCRGPEGVVLTCRPDLQQFATVHFTTKRAGMAFFTAVLSARGEATNQGTAQPQLVAYIDRNQVPGAAQSHFPADSVAPTSIPFQGGLAVRRGRHTLEIRVWPLGTDPGTMHIDQATVQVQVMPTLS